MIALRDTLTGCPSMLNMRSLMSSASLARRASRFCHLPVSLVFFTVSGCGELLSSHVLSCRRSHLYATAASFIIAHLLLPGFRSYALSHDKRCVSWGLPFTKDLLFP